MARKTDLAVRSVVRASVITRRGRRAREARAGPAAAAAAASGFGGQGDPSRRAAPRGPAGPLCRPSSAPENAALITAITRRASKSRITRRRLVMRGARVDRRPTLVLDLCLSMAVAQSRYHYLCPLHDAAAAHDSR